MIKIIKSYEEVCDEIKMINGNINRMILTGDIEELKKMNEYAIRRIEEISRFCLQRLTENNKGDGGE